MLRIRLQRIGRKKSPSYRVVISEGTKDTQARSLEILGEYNPIAQPKVIKFKEDRIKHWLSVGAQPSNTVHNLLVNAGIIKEDKAKSVTITKKRQGKINEKKGAAEEEKKQAEEAKAAEAAAPVEETPTEEKPVEAPTEEAAPKEEEKTPEVEEKKEEEPVKAEASEETPTEEKPEEKLEEAKVEKAEEKPAE